MPPEKHRSPVEAIARDKTGPVWALNVYTGSTSKAADFLAGIVFCKFHNFKVWSSEAVMRTGSVGWKPRARTPSKWLLSVYLALQVFRNASLGAVICWKKEQNLIVFLEYYQTIRALFWFRKAKTGNTVSLIVWISEVHQDIETVFPTLANQTLKTWLFLEKFGYFWKQLFKKVGNTALNRTFQGQGYPRWTLDKCLISPWICSFDQGWTNLVLWNKK